MVTVDDNRSLTNLVAHNENMAGVTAFLDLNNLWSMSMETTRQRILDRLAAARPGGQSLYDVSLNLPSQGFQEIAQDEWGTHLRLTLSGAYLEATSTQPTFLGSWADPRFGLSFDITVDVDLAPTGGLRVTNMVASISNAQIHDVNVVSDVLDFYNLLVHSFTGISFKSLAEAEINGTEFRNAIDTSATSLVNTLAPGASVVYDAESGVVLLRTQRKDPPIDINTWQPGFVTDADLDAVFTKTGTGAATILDRDNLDLAFASSWTDVLKDIRFSESYNSPIPRGDTDLFGMVNVASDFDWAMLNPQPLPPKDLYFSDFASEVDLVALNPQPLPPRDSILPDASFASDFDWALLNPQPLPPKDLYFGDVASELELVALNPQPLPPRDSILSDASFASDFDWALLNPQPLPPKDMYFDEFASELDLVSLNPQPLPPKDDNLSTVASDLDSVALNPQPLPPQESYLSPFALSSTFDAVMLNPQPLPPKEAYSGGLASQFDAVALNPQPLPPKDIGLFSTPTVSYARTPIARYFR
jgi:hypothetical protein